MSLTRKIWLPTMAALLATSAAVVLHGRLFAGEFVAIAVPLPDWPVPPSAEAKQNPYPADAKTIAAGKALFDRNCVACHGATGKGDGPAAAYLQTRPADLGDPGIAKYSDGNLFYKVTEGRSSMPSYRTMLTDEQRWELVDYIRTFAQKAADKQAAGG